jgi:hypothetical protein
MAAWLLLGSLAQAQQEVRPHSPLANPWPSSSTPTAEVGPSAPPYTGPAQLLPPGEAPFVPTSMQRLPPIAAPGPVDTADQAAVQEITIQLEPPPPNRLFKLESERSLRERIRQENLNRNQKIYFPEEPILSTEQYPGRHWPPMHMVVEPMFVGFNRLFFHQINFERYGWDLGPISPVLSGLAFYKDLILMPYHQFTDPLRLYEYNRGWCLPGDAVPLYFYPTPISATGLLGQVGAVVLVLVTFP